MHKRSTHTGEVCGTQYMEHTVTYMYVEHIGHTHMEHTYIYCKVHGTCEVHAKTYGSSGKLLGLNVPGAWGTGWNVWTLGQCSRESWESLKEEKSLGQL